MWPNMQVKFTEEILNGKHFLYSGINALVIFNILCRNLHYNSHFHVSDTYLNVRYTSGVGSP